MTVESAPTTPTGDWRIRLFAGVLLPVLVVSMALLMRDSRRIVAASAMPLPAVLEVVPQAAISVSPYAQPQSGESSSAHDAGAYVLALFDTSESVRLAAIRDLERLGDRQAARILALALRDPSVRVRRNVIEALGGIPVKGVAELLLPALGDSDSEVRESAIEALADTGDENILDVLGYALHDAEPAVRLEAVDALGEIDDEWARSLLQLALADAQPHIRAAAAELLDD